ncbi:hypothetical protein JCGZ_09736 [Jatropha curcas]|uniref:Pyrrolo-quinoline quinone repeat domain-containing protein n=1 Tax=Jatropha curcas TaxID=180498 RepID=A0A067LAQ1_JATCU|nr:polyvinylalcohol dehydrogenase [Jatropha curcas]KDP45487.1 hypothetical protein JCGZ_09736 [Jatropha curcas]
MATSGSCSLLVFFLCTLCAFITNGTRANSNWQPHYYKRDKATQNWLNHGGDLQNRRYANKETKINPKTASKLGLKWKFLAGGDISATPAIFNGTLYFPSWNGYIYAVKAFDGSLIWKKNLQNLSGVIAPSFLSLLNVNSTASRSTPTVVADADLLIFGTYGPAVVVAVKRSTGDFVWATQVETHLASVITMSGTYYKGSYYIGASSIEEGASIAQCCTFRGSFIKLDPKTGKILWKTYMLPDNFNKTGNYSGAAVWGSSPSIDKHRNLVFIATGNLYSVPQHVRECQEKENNATKPTHLDQCLGPDIHSESILALDLDSGKIKWSHQLGGYDVWFVACSIINFTSPDCPIPGPNPDADFGEAPMMLNIKVNGSRKDVVVAVQKSGFAWALDRDDGNLIWSTEAGPGGIGGGGTWGAATDKKRIYTNIVNSDGKNFTLKPSNKTTNSGGWVAMNAHNGKVLWSVPDPSNAWAFGPVTIANGVLFAGSTFREGPIYAIDAKTGKILWRNHTGATIFGGASVSDGCIYFGHGYKVSTGTANPLFTRGKSLFAFCVT